jgi:hypothetical protein
MATREVSELFCVPNKLVIKIMILVGKKLDKKIPTGFGSLIRRSYLPDT